MASNRFTRTRATLASKSRIWDDDDPRMVALREQLRTAVVVQRIEIALDKGPGLTPELRAEIDVLLDERMAAVA